MLNILMHASLSIALIVSVSFNVAISNKAVRRKTEYRIKNEIQVFIIAEQQNIITQHNVLNVQYNSVFRRQQAA